MDFFSFYFPIYCRYPPPEHVENLSKGFDAEKKVGHRDVLEFCRLGVGEIDLKLEAIFDCSCS